LQKSGVDFVTAVRLLFSALSSSPMRISPREIFCAMQCAAADSRSRRGHCPALLSPSADLVVWLLRILLRGQRARAYNVGSDNGQHRATRPRIAEAVLPTPEVYQS